MATTRKILINSNASTPQPPTDPREARPVVATTLSGKPVVQGYAAVTLQYPYLDEADMAILMGFYNPASPAVTLQLFDETGGVDKTYNAMMNPPQVGSHGPGWWKDISVRFTRLVAAS